MDEIQNAINNEQKLGYAKNVLSEEQYDKLCKAYNQLFWIQIAPLIILVVIVILEAIFIPTGNVPEGCTPIKWMIIMLEACFFIVLVMPIHFVISLTAFRAGRLWRRYSKWYDGERNPELIPNIFR